MIHLALDLRSAMIAVKTIEQWSKQVNSDEHVNKLMKSLGEFLNAGFNMYVHQLYSTAPLAYHHVYEWGVKGSSSDIEKQAGKLWRTKIFGHGAKRELKYYYLSSKKAVPVNPKLTAIGVKKKDIFYWKAPVMERGGPVRIAPIGPQLVFFGTRMNKIFSFKKNSPRLPFVVTNPGGDAVGGSFMRAWVSYNLAAQGDIQDSYIQPIERSVQVNFQKELTRIGKRSSGIKVGFSTAEYATAKTTADRIFKAQTRAYGKANQNRRGFVDS